MLLSHGERVRDLLRVGKLEHRDAGSSDSFQAAQKKRCSSDKAGEGAFVSGLLVYPAATLCWMLMHKATYNTHFQRASANGKRFDPSTD